MGHGGGVGPALLLCVWVPVSAASSELDAQADSAPTVVAAWIDLAETPPVVEQAAEAEAKAILADAGLRLDWRAVSPGARLGTGVVRVVALPFSARRPPPGRCLLGSSNANPLAPTAWVHYPDVMRTLGLDTTSVGIMRFEDQRRAGVALGRVAAHELVHLMLPELAHAETGLMAGGTSRRWLLARQLSLDEDSSRALRTVLTAR